MDSKGKERGILKLEPRARASVEGKAELTAEGSCDRPLSSPQPSVDRLSVTWADPGSMTSSGVNLFHLPSDTPISNEVKFSPSGGDGSEDEDYSASLSAVLRQRRASVRRSRKGRPRRSSSPFLADENRSRRRSSVFTTSSGDTAISMEEQPTVTQEQIFENIHLHKEVLGAVKQQPLGMRRKLKIVHQAKGYIKQHEGQLQERLAQSKSTRDIYARFNILIATKWQQLKREAANTSNLLIPWELRIKEIESHFGSVVASYFTFLRWLFWVNLVIGFILLVFVIIPENLTANPEQDGERKIIMEDEKRNATNLLTLWEFEGYLKYSSIFYGYYSNVERPEYRMPLAYFLTGLVVYIYSFVAILRKMAENSRMSKLSEKDDECIFSWKLFTGWDFMIGNTETAHNRIASVILGFKEALLEEAEKKRNSRNWRILSLRAIVNLCVVILLIVSAYAVVTVVSRSDDNPKIRSWWRENETTIVVTIISISFPVLFELLGYLEHYHPRKQLRLQLARIMLLNLLNLYSLIFALFSKIEGMSKDLVSLQPTLNMNATTMSETILNINETLAKNVPEACVEIQVPCTPCTIVDEPQTKSEANQNNNIKYNTTTKENKNTNEDVVPKSQKQNLHKSQTTQRILTAENLEEDRTLVVKEIERLRNIGAKTNNFTLETYDNDTYDFINYDIISPPDLDTTSESWKYSDATEETLSSLSSHYYLSSSSYLETKSDFSSTTEENFDDTTTDMTTTVDDNSQTTLKLSHSSSEDIETSSPIFSTDTTFFGLSTTEVSTNSYDFTTDAKITTLRKDNVFQPYKTTSFKDFTMCPNLSINCSINCGDKILTKIIYISNYTIVDIKCYFKKCLASSVETNNTNSNITNITTIDTVFIDNHSRKIYNLTIATKKKLLKLCWETMFGQELVKLTMMDLVFVVLGTLFMDFFRALFVRYMNRCWCWDLEKKFPEYGDFKIAENILHLINNQGLVWMGMFFSPGLVVLNVVKLMIMMYLRSWAVMTCNVPHEVVFRVSKSNNFYLALLLTMLFLCVLPVGYTIVWVKPSWHCGPFSEYDKIYKILTRNIYKVLPKSLNFALEYIASPAIVIPLLVLLILIIYYLTSLTNSLREANNDLKIQLRRERTEERRKMFQLADTRRRTGLSSIDNTPFARWKKALPSLPISKSIDSDDPKAVNGDEIKESRKNAKKKGGTFAKIVDLAIDNKSDRNTHSSQNPMDDETDTDFHENLPKEILRMKDITLAKNIETKKKNSVEFKTDEKIKAKSRRGEKHHNYKTNENDETLESIDSLNQTDKANQSYNTELYIHIDETKSKDQVTDKILSQHEKSQSKQLEPITSVIPVITISTTESDDEVLQPPKSIEKCKKIEYPELDSQVQIPAKDNSDKKKHSLKKIRKCPDFKLLRRQSSVESIHDNKEVKDKKSYSGHKYQYSL